MRISNWEADALGSPKGLGACSRHQIRVLVTRVLLNQFLQHLGFCVRSSVVLHSASAEVMSPCVCGRERKQCPVKSLRTSSTNKVTADPQRCRRAAAVRKACKHYLHVHLTPLMLHPRSTSTLRVTYAGYGPASMCEVCHGLQYSTILHSRSFDWEVASQVCPLQPSGGNPKQRLCRDFDCVKDVSSKTNEAA